MNLLHLLLQFHGLKFEATEGRTEVTDFGQAVDRALSAYMVRSYFVCFACFLAEAFAPVAAD